MKNIVNLSYISSCLFQDFQSLANEISNAVILSLGVVDLVPDVFIAVLEQVEHWQQLSVVWHEGLSDVRGFEDKLLDDLHGNGHDVEVSCVEGN